MKKMNQTDASRIQSATARRGGGVSEHSFSARAQRAAAAGKGSGPQNGPSQTGNPSGGGRGNNPPKGK